MIFSYEVDPATKAECLSIIERALVRVSRGEPAFIGDRTSHAKRIRAQGKTTGRGSARREVEESDRETAIKLWIEGANIHAIAAVVPLPLNTLHNILRGIPRERRRTASV